MINRRSLLLGLSAALAAPAIVRADSLMKLWVPKPKLVTLDDYEEGTFTPTLWFTDGTSMEYTGPGTQRYTRIGKMVRIDYNFESLPAGVHMVSGAPDNSVGLFFD